MARRNRNGVRKERIIMMASSVLVLTALTVTGVFVKRNNNAEKDDYVVDFEAIEKSSERTAENMMTGEELDTLFAEVGTDDLDYDPSFQEANSQNVENNESKLSPVKQEDGKKGGAEEKKEDALGKKSDEDDKITEQDKKEQSLEKKEDAGKDQKKKEDESAEGMFDETVDTAQNNA